jgi:hypothetical protein
MQERKTKCECAVQIISQPTCRGDTGHFICSVNYDLKVLKIRAQRHQRTADYVVNPAFWPALGINVTAMAA